MSKPYDLPSLGDLACFEAAARNLSFKLASTELNVTPAAVSTGDTARLVDSQEIPRSPHQGPRAPAPIPGRAPYRMYCERSAFLAYSGGVNDQ